MPKLTEKAASAARAGSKDVFLWDGELRGFGLRVMPSGVKTFILQYRNGRGDSKRVKIARYLPPDYPVARARRKARKLLASIDDGADPAEHRRRERKMAGNTVEAIAAQHIAEYAKARLRSWRERERIFKTYVNPVLDLHRFRAEKRDALDRWARLLSNIVMPPEGKITDLESARASRMISDAAAPRADQGASPHSVPAAP